MQVRKLLPEEHKNTRSLYEEAFPEDSVAFVDYYYTEVTEDNRIYVVEDEARICAMLHLNPYEISLNGENNQLDYIVAVATKKEYRRRGYMAALLKCALSDMYQEGKPFTYLMPAKEDIYLPYDFRTVCKQEIPWCEEKVEKTEETKTELQQEQCELLAQCAEKYLKDHYQLYTVRDKKYYERMQRAYACDGGKIFVKENDGQITGCEYYYPPEETLEETMKQRPKIMFRIVDVKRMLMSMKLKTLMAACFTVTDSLIEENNCCMTVTGTEFSGVLLMEGLQKNSEGTLTIAALAELLFGVKTPEELCREEGVMMTERLKGELKKLVPVKQIYLNEMV